MFANGVEWGWNGAILGGILGGRRGMGGEFCWIFGSREHIEGERVDKRTVFCPEGCVLKKNHSLLKVFVS